MIHTDSNSRRPIISIDQKSSTLEELREKSSKSQLEIFLIDWIEKIQGKADESPVPTG